MSISLISTGIQFPDSTIQTTAAGAGGVTSLNGQTGAIINTTLYAIGSYITGRPKNATSYGVDSTIAGSSLYSMNAVGGVAYDWDYNYFYWDGDVSATLVNTGSWRCVSPAFANGTYRTGKTGLWVRYA